MRVYIEVAKRVFRQQLAYRAANLAGLATNAFWGALRSFLFLGLLRGREVAAGWDVHDAIDYIWLTQAMIMPVYFWNWWEIADTIRTGDVVSDLAKPVDYRRHRNGQLPAAHLSRSAATLLHLCRASGLCLLLPSAVFARAA
jgi:ABC-2 type transport system permease protein